MRSSSSSKWWSPSTLPCSSEEKNTPTRSAPHPELPLPYYEDLGQLGQDGSNVIPRRARPGPAGLGPHTCAFLVRAKMVVTEHSPMLKRGEEYSDEVPKPETRNPNTEHRNPTPDTPHRPHTLHSLCPVLSCCMQRWWSPIRALSHAQG